MKVGLSVMWCGWFQSVQCNGWPQDDRGQAEASAARSWSDTSGDY